MYRIGRALLFLLPAEAAHRLVVRLLGMLSGFPALARWMRARAAPPFPSLAVRMAGLRFEHPIALAAGLDKDGEAVSGLFALGFGAVEVGSVTPRPQPGNPRPRIFRLRSERAVINRMGMNNHGAPRAAERLARVVFRPGPVGVNVAKNKDTPLEESLSDYQAAVRILAPHGDYVVVNASSPNTPGLRQLQAPQLLSRLLRGIREALDEVTPGKPLFLKISPDLALEELDALVEVAVAAGAQGLVATNTTLERPVQHPLAEEAGGLSGAPLAPRAMAVLRRVAVLARGRLALIAVGGVFTAEDAYQRIRAGASLVQVYTGLVYQGPGMVRQLTEGLDALLRADGFSHIEEAIGRDLPSHPAEAQHS